MRSKSEFNVGRQTMAIGAWVFLVFMMGLVPREVPVWAAFFLLILISVSSAISLLLISEDWRRRSRPPRWGRFVSIGIAFAVPIGWAVWLDSKSTFPAASFLSLFSVFPPLIACLMSGRTSDTLHQKKSATSSESTFTENESLLLSKLADESVEQGEQVPIELGIVSDQEASVPANFTQWLTRYQTPEGELIEGGVRVDFQQGQRDATVHVSFCPPLERIPDVTAEDLDGADLEIRVAAAFPFGVRLTVRRRQSSQSRGEKFLAATCRIGFIAVSSTSQRVA